MTAAVRAAPFVCEKQSATGSKGMVVANHPLSSGAGAQMLLAGGNAIDAAVASLFASTVVEPMMVGITGGGLAHLRLADGRHLVVDGLSTAPAAARPDMYETLSTELAHYQDTRDRQNAVGPLAMAVPGALRAWCGLVETYGMLPLADVMAPAIRLAEHGFAVSPYLTDAVTDCAADLAQDDAMAALFLPGDKPIAAGETLRQRDYAESLKLIAKHGPDALYNGPLGRALCDHMARAGGLIRQDDLSSYTTVNRDVVRGRYRDFEIVGPPPPSSSGVHIVQMLNILEGFDIRGMGFGSAETIHLLAEVMKIAFADRAVATADPAFVDVPVDAIIAKAYAVERRQQIDLQHAKAWAPGIASGESHDTTHVSVADAFGNVVAATQTVNGVFGSRFIVPGTGMVANNYMFNFDPHPGHALSVAPGKRVYTSMSPMMATQNGKVRYVLGLPGGLRIFGSAMQGLINLIDHGMSLQEAVEAPRIWTQGGPLEVESKITLAVIDELARRGHNVQRVPRVAGGMNAIAFEANGLMTGAACWRADGSPVGISGGYARAGVRFSVN